MGNDSNSKQGQNLTLIEVILGVLLVVVLAVFVFVAMGKARENSNRSRCLGQLRQIALAMKAYANDNTREGGFPWNPTMTTSNELFNAYLVAKQDYAILTNGSVETIGGYVTDTRIFRCPSDKFPLPASASLTAAGRCSYSVMGGPMMDYGSSAMPIVADSQTAKNHPHGDAGQNVFYTDGHGLWLKTPPPITDFEQGRTPPSWLNPAGY